MTFDQFIKALPFDRIDCSFFRPTPWIAISANLGWTGGWPFPAEKTWPSALKCCAKFGSQIRTFSMDENRTCTPSPLQISLCGFSQTDAYSTHKGRKLTFSKSKIDSNSNFVILHSVLSLRLTIRASCQMDLSDFPMDKQNCPLYIGSCKSRPSRLRELRAHCSAALFQSATPRMTCFTGGPKAEGST